MPLPALLVGGLSAAAIGAFVRAFFKHALAYAGPLVVQALVFLGLSIASQEYVIGPMVADLGASLNGAPEFFVQTVAYVGADQAMTMILSAYAARAAGRLVLRRVRS